MKKLMRKIVAAILVLAIAFISTPITVFADTETLLKDKTNKLTISDSMKESYSKIEESLAAGKSITYEIEVSKGTLYIELADKTSYKIEIFNNKKKLVKKIESVEIISGMAYHVRYGVKLSKGKYIMKISPKSKKSALNISGKVAIIRNGSSGNIVTRKDYDIAVTKGKTYKFKFEVKNADSFGLATLLTSFDPNDIFPFENESKVVNSKGKTIMLYNDTHFAFGTLKKGKYTVVFKAKKSGYISLKVY